MARDRVISADSNGPEEERLDLALRPEQLADCVGQTQLIDQLVIALAAARKRSEPLEHILLDGPPGLGKTTLAHVIAHEMNVGIRVTSGPAIVKQGDLMTMLTNMEAGEILFIDEIHRLARVVEEFLYPAMEDFRVDYTVEGGLGGRTINFALKRFTLIGATTRAGMLTAALRDRFGIRYHLTFYTADELTQILRRSASLLKLDHEDGALQAIAGRSRGTPRVANRLLRRARDYAQVRADGTLTTDVVARALEIQQVDKLGLDELDRAYLTTLAKTYEGGPAGVEAIAASMGQERDTLEDVVEPYLLQIGFITRTRQGRQITADACKHVGLPPTRPSKKRPAQDTDQPSLF